MNGSCQSCVYHSENLYYDQELSYCGAPPEYSCLLRNGVVEKVGPDTTPPNSQRPPQSKPAGGIKHDQEKLRYDLVPVDAMAEVARIFTFGADKYGDRNWERGMEWGRLYAAARRHLDQWWAGESIDRESGVQHLAHAATDCLMLLAYALRGSGSDDRKILERVPDMTFRRPSGTRS